MIKLPSPMYRMLYYFLQKRRKEPVKDVLEELLSTEKLSVNKLQELQWERLLKLIEHAYNKSAYYRQLFKENNIHPRDIRTKNDLIHIPVLTKKNVQTESERLFCGDQNQRPYTLASTSGSSGIPLKLSRDNESWAHLHGNIFRGLSWYGVKLGAPYAMVGGIGGGFSTRLKGVLKDYVLNRIHLYAYDMNKDRCLQFLKQINRFGAQYLYGYPTAIYDLAEIAEQEKIEFTTGPLKLVLTHGEELENYQKEKIGSVFKTRVINSFGCAEIGLIGFECPEGGFHIPIESIYLEVIDGSTVVTDLFSYSFPMIRYDLGDSLELTDDPCPCGRSLPIFKNLKGKLRHVIELDNGRRIHTVFFNSLFKDLCHKGAPIEKYQIVRDSDNTFTAKVIAGDLSSGYRDYMQRSFTDQFGTDCTLNIQLVDQIKKTQSGKFRTYYEKKDRSSE